jgi:hypothetical protein
MVQALVAAGTIGLAAVTLALVLKTKGMVEVSRRALEVGVRPFLADPRPIGPETLKETLAFGAPGRISPSVPHGSIFWNSTEDGGVSHFSIAFENVGAGTAAITAWRTEPKLPGNVYASRKFAPVGSLLRINVSVLIGLPGAEMFANHWWAMNGIKTVVDHSDTCGGELLTSTAYISQCATQGPFVQEITVHRKSDGQLLAAGRSSY